MSVLAACIICIQC